MILVSFLGFWWCWVHLWHFQCDPSRNSAYFFCSFACPWQNTWFKWHWHMCYWQWHIHFCSSAWDIWWQGIQERSRIPHHNQPGNHDEVWCHFISLSTWTCPCSVGCIQEGSSWTQSKYGWSPQWHTLLVFRKSGARFSKNLKIFLSFSWVCRKYFLRLCRQSYCQNSPLVLEWPSLKSAMFVSLSVSGLYWAIVLKVWWLFIPRFLGLVLELVKLVVGYWDELLISDVRGCQVPWLACPAD